MEIKRQEEQEESRKTEKLIQENVMTCQMLKLSTLDLKQFESRVTVKYLVDMNSRVDI